MALTLFDSLIEIPAICPCPCRTPHSFLATALQRPSLRQREQSSSAFLHPNRQSQTDSLTHNKKFGNSWGKCKGLKQLSSLNTSNHTYPHLHLHNSHHPSPSWHQHDSFNRSLTSPHHLTRNLLRHFVRTPTIRTHHFLLLHKHHAPHLPILPPPTASPAQFLSNQL